MATRTYSLFDLVTRVAANLGDLVLGTTDVGATALNELRDAARAVEKDGRYNGSEILFSMPYAEEHGMVGSPLYGVLEFRRDNGVFLLNQNWSASSGVPAGVDYAMLNLGGRGYPAESIVYALELAFDALALVHPLRDESTLLVPGVYNYPIPDAFSSVSRFEILRSWSGRPYTLPLVVGGATGVAVQPESRTVILNASCVEGDKLAITGRRKLSVPATYYDDDAVPLARVEAVVNAAIEMLTRTGNSGQQTIAANQYGDRVRTVPLYRDANSIPLP